MCWGPCCVLSNLKGLLLRLMPSGDGVGHLRRPTSWVRCVVTWSVDGGGLWNIDFRCEVVRREGKGYGIGGDASLW